MKALPVRVRALMVGRVSSIEKLVVILELRKRKNAMYERDLRRQCSIDEVTLTETLHDLHAARIVEWTSPAVELLEPDADLVELLRCYDDDPVTTVNALSNIAMERIRRMAIVFSETLKK